MKTIQLTRGNDTKIIPTGFSFTTLLFGFWPSLFRLHWHMFWFCILGEIVPFITIMLNVPDWYTITLWTIWRFVTAFIRNKELRYSLASDGWKTSINFTIPIMGRAANN